MHAALLLAVASLLLVLINVQVVDLLTTTTGSEPTASSDTTEAVSGSTTPANVGDQTTAPTTDSELTEARFKELLGAESDRLRASLQEATVQPLRQRSALALLALAPLALWMGWLLSGAAIRPFAEVTVAVRRMAGRNVRERLDRRGPRDEVLDLTTTMDDLLARLEEAENGQWRFVANASHELKTPLAVNRTLIEVALMRPDCPPQLSELGMTLLEVNARHDRLITGLLTLASSEHAVIRPVPMDLANVVEVALDIAKREAEAAGVRLTFEGGPVPLDGDPTLLERLALNLVQNAVRYNVPDGWVRVTCTSEASRARLTVTNSGLLVPAHEVPRMFEPFHRLHDRVGSAHGNGLGLAIARSVARAHGGEVVATARPEGGLRVEVDLPATLHESPATPATPRPAERLSAER
jgi:signal transduction histidine kinase